MPEQSRIGPGTELKRMLAKIGIKPETGCPCDERALLMDLEGPAWCLKHLDIIVDWLEEEAKRRKIPFNRLLTVGFVRLAIWRARRKLKMLERQGSGIPS